MCYYNFSPNKQNVPVLELLNLAVSVVAVLTAGRQGRTSAVRAVAEFSVTRST